MVKSSRVTEASSFTTSDADSNYGGLFELKVDSFSGIEGATSVLCGRVPELKFKDFKVDTKKKTSVLRLPKELTFPDFKITLQKCRITLIRRDTYHVEVLFNTLRFRPFFFLFVMIGCLFWIVPGLIIYGMFREPESAAQRRAEAALSRFDSLISVEDENEEDEPSEDTFNSANENRESETSDPLENADEIASRLHRLQDLFESGDISEDEHALQRERILSGL